MRKAFISPAKYVQGENEIENLGYFVKTFCRTKRKLTDKNENKIIHPIEIHKYIHTYIHTFKDSQRDRKRRTDRQTDSYT
jgi:glycerol dehydrogenase